METKYLIINLGSSSKRYAFFIDDSESLSAHFKNEHGQYVVTIKDALQTRITKISQDTFTHSLKYFLELIENQTITTIGLRVVAPGIYFTQHRKIDFQYIIELEKAQKIAPLHINSLLFEIKQSKELLGATQIVGISDSRFHITMPYYAKVYALPAQVTKKYGIYHFGYHGISIQSITRSLSSLLGYLPSHVIVCHLGSGSSVTALKNGKSIDTSMGFTPLQGIPMSSRIGDVDPGILTYLAQEKKLSPEQLNVFLNTKCGLLGLSEETADMKELLQLAQSGNSMAQRAIEVYTYSIKKYIGCYAACLGGLDLLLFTGGIGENSSLIRSLICKNLTLLNIDIDTDKNNSCIDQDRFIQKSSSIPIAVILTDEMREMVFEIKNIA